MVLGKQSNFISKDFAGSLDFTHQTQFRTSSRTSISNVSHMKPMICPVACSTLVCKLYSLCILLSVVIAWSLQLNSISLLSLCVYRNWISPTPRHSVCSPSQWVRSLRTDWCSSRRNTESGKILRVNRSCNNFGLLSTWDYSASIQRGGKSRSTISKSFPFQLCASFED